MRNIYSVKYSEFKKHIMGQGYPGFHADNVFRWIYSRRVKDFSSMTDIPLSLRSYLNDNFEFRLPEVVDKRTGPDGTTKFLMRLEDGETVESVLIPEKGHYTFCISSQIGCKMGCKFCATGASGFVRNLKHFEITGQILRLLENVDDRVNIVFMGMGEPLDNPDEVSMSIEVMRDWVGISPRKITLSTVGLVDQLEPLLKKFPNLRIALSLNFASEEKRTEFMPINKKYPIKRIIKVLGELPIKRRDRITIEYVLIEGINDSEKDALALGNLIKGLKVKINLIPYNENEFFPWKSPSYEKVEKFASILRGMKYSVFVRFSKGNEIKAACGQLRAQRG
ncbi:MAG: 23S rRNA (adenine(2503)-C(2))-methyltransferase RlmN [Candidatus Aminicenantes bacterium]|nr:23S rRNA (adenine(2503)-C(2))-methyltransferase RlmN [Candidatus Aminicenantes bacterium]